ncbi:hypothetical protein ASPZODRAFT_546800 [Penicilliopsis zonata CBS 506.65]|uniref:GED domain-containing protein n=1 Tax=Penicilliopsis zonata CBS 506.65 TaxID=1073090 RepID=A0A1L9SFX3_9EURO|nr:hypothetical protein ASPZODRAFT_546800 [Penicilliopsis zonata CBS 506.65]OJJ45924.1 hypothetical protein ASPZODRAFT_546800 [Penicilliopsis zonata CBS 506.65]
MASPPDKGWVTLDPGPLGRDMGLQSSKTSSRLNQIDRIRANGVGDRIALPQLVVGGDQSAGKSSVLEGISGIPFPRQDDLCTRFATEIILRHDPSDPRITASIIPHRSRSEEEKVRLGAFRHELKDFSTLPDIIDQAARLMGLRGSRGGSDTGSNTESDSDADGDAPAFAADVLRLELVGNTGLHLTIVDLPGLIAVSDNEEDVATVERLVDSYLKNPRSIILAVVPASSDVDTQGIIQRARRFDQEGVRTVGIITKPDLINAGTESRVARLALNQDRTKLNLGFFILKNPSPSQLQAGMTLSQRRKVEMDFFSSPVWTEQGLDSSRIGIDNLRTYLQDLLDSHIQREMPKVRKEVQQLLNNVTRELNELGTERKSPGQIRMYLTRTSTDYSNLVKAGVEGNYGGRDAKFFQIEDDEMFVRLRAEIHLENEKFANHILDYGEKRKMGSTFGEDDSEQESQQEGSQLFVTEKEMTSWIEQVYHRTRGQELPGNYNPALLTELFHEQSCLWAQIAREHVQVISRTVTKFMERALGYVVKDSQVRENLSRFIRGVLQSNLRAAEEELERLLEDEARQPITYNHYYTDNIQKSRHDQSKAALQKTVRQAIDKDWGGVLHFQNSIAEINRLVASLQRHTIVDMGKQACADALTDLKAYYKVSRKTFVDNVCRQVVERHLLAHLADGFNPMTVLEYTDEDLLRLAAESPRIADRRAEALKLRDALEKSLLDLAE